MKNFENKTKIKKVGKDLRDVIGLFLIIIVLAGVPLIVQDVVKGYREGGWTLFHAISDLVVFPVYSIFLFQLFRFFGRVAKGYLFDAQTVAKLDAAGRWLIAYWFCKSLYVIIATACYPGVMDSQVNNFSLSELLLGFGLILTAWLFREAQELQDEQKLTV